MNHSKVNTLKLSGPDYPALLKNIPDAPHQLFYQGAPPQKWLESPKVAVVGSRKISSYGKIVTDDITSQLARAGMTIISGLAYGVDAAAHTAALDTGGITVAVLPTSLDKIYPAAHHNLAKRILERGGTLITEYPAGSDALLVNFLARNRIVSGLSDAVLITEAAANSGTLHTANFALNQGKTVMAIPGNITSPTSVGCNNLIKNGAVPVTAVDDIFFALNLKPISSAPKVFRGSPDEEMIFNLIAQGAKSQEELALESSLTSAALNTALTTLEISGHVRNIGNGRWITS